MGIDTFLICAFAVLTGISFAVVQISERKGWR